MAREGGGGRTIGIGGGRAAGVGFGIDGAGGREEDGVDQREEFVVRPEAEAGCGGGARGRGGVAGGGAAIGAGRGGSTTVLLFAVLSNPSLHNPSTSPSLHHLRHLSTHSLAPQVLQSPSSSCPSQEPSLFFSFLTDDQICRHSGRARKCAMRAQRLAKRSDWERTGE